jgi:cytochrome c oxidase subunit 1
MTFVVSVMSAIKIFNWTLTMYKGKISFDAPMIYGVSFIGLFLVGGLTGLMLAMTGLDMDLHGTYFVIAHFHYIMVGGSVMAYFAALHFWWPKVTGRMYSDLWARIAAVLIFLGFNFTFFPQYLLGVRGMPRRYHAYPPEFQVLNLMSSMGAVVLALGYLLPLVYLAWSLHAGRKAGANPFDARGLEWQADSPPPTHNFDTPPRLPQQVYDYDPNAPVKGTLS